jgi:glycosyltransferase involved in cell wall biosynthesis
MRLVIFSYVFYPEKFLINSLAIQLSKRHEIIISTGLPNYPEGFFYSNYGLLKGPYSEFYGDISIKRYPMLPRGKSFIGLALNYLSHILGGIMNIFRLGSADCVFVFATSPIMTAIPAILYAKWRKVPVVIWLQDLWPESFLAVTGRPKDSVLAQILGVMVRWIYKNTDIILIQSPDFKQNLEEYGFSGEVHWIPNWAPEEDKFQSEPEWVEEIPENKFVVTFAGNIGHAQKLETLLLAAEKLEGHEDIFFAIVGDGVAKKELNNRFSSLSNVKFFGRRPVEDMSALFRRSSALLVMLKDDPVFSLTLPSKVQSYMQAARAIIGSLNGVGARVIENHEVGRAVPAEDVGALVEVLLQFSKMSPEKLKKLGDNAYESYIEHYEQDKVIKKIEELLDSLIKS